MLLPKRKVNLKLMRERLLKYEQSKGLSCCVDDFSRSNKKEKDIVSMQELIQSLSNDCVIKYTPEETELHQRMVNVLTNQIDMEEIKKEEVKQLRLQRKLEKSKK